MRPDNTRLILVSEEERRRRRGVFTFWCQTSSNGQDLSKYDAATFLPRDEINTFSHPLMHNNAPNSFNFQIPVRTVLPGSQSVLSLHRPPAADTRHLAHGKESDAVVCIVLVVPQETTDITWFPCAGGARLRHCCCSCCFPC